MGEWGSMGKTGLVASFVVLGIVGFGIWGAFFYPPVEETSLPITTLSNTAFDSERTAILIHERVNAERARAGLASLAWNDDLALVAQAHSADMAARSYFDHISPDGKDHRDRYDNAGINCMTLFSNGTFDNGSENIASGSDVGSEVQEAQLTVSSWMDSTAGHRENMLNSVWKSEGIGVAVGNDVIYVTQNFCN